MAGSIRLEVVTPEKSVVSDEAQIVVAPGTQGEFGVLVGHTPFLTTLKTGIVRYTDTGGKEHFVFVSGGFAEALPSKVTILAESAEKSDEVDLERARAALERAKKRLEDANRQEGIDRNRAKAALERAMFRISLKGG
jgi:F-type H+-transporting ATPase subunit epsilon